MEYLKQPITIKNIKIKNRLVFPPMATSRANDGVVTKELIEYYDEKSKGGAIGLIIIEHSYINKQGMASSKQLSISRDSDVDGLKKIVDVIHKNGSKVIAQISHAGSKSNPAITGMFSIAPSPILYHESTENLPLPHEMSEQDINKVIQDFVDAALRVKQAGFDGVELHSAHGYLLNQFYSPLTNKRTDAYTGKTIEGRIRLHLQILDAIQKTIGHDFPIAIRLGADDLAEGGTTLDDSMQAAKIFEENGIDLFDISGGVNGYAVCDQNIEGFFSHLTEAMKKAVSTPIILTGGIRNIATAEALLKNEKADMIGVGRTILKDSHWAINGMKQKED